MLHKTGRPPALLDILYLQPDAKVGIAVESGRLVLEPQRKRRYTLDELLAQCDPKASGRDSARGLDKKTGNGLMSSPWAANSSENS